METAVIEVSASLGTQARTFILLTFTNFPLCIRLGSRGLGNRGMDEAEGKKENNHCLHGAYILVGEMENLQVNK